MERVLTDKQLPPPKESDFEDFALDFFRERWKDPKANFFGVKGSTQNGVDIFGLPFGETEYFGVQCKWKDRTKSKSLIIDPKSTKNSGNKDDIYSQIDEVKNFHIKLKEFILVTTATRQTAPQQVEMEISLKHRTEGLFGFQIIFWDDFEKLIPGMLFMREKWYPNVFGTVSNPAVVTEEQKFRSRNSKLLEDSLANVNQITIGSGNKNIQINQVNSDNGLVHNTKVDTAKLLLENNNPVQAISLLETIKKEIWSNCDSIIKFRILTNLGVGYSLAGEPEKTAQLFIEALQYNKEDEKALLNCAVGHLFLGNKIQATQIIEKVLKSNSQSARAYSIKVDLLQGTDTNIEELIASIPANLLSDSAIASSLSRFAKQSSIYDLDEAEKWARIAINENSKDHEHIIELAEILLQKVLDDHMVVFADHISQENEAFINESIELFSSAWEMIDDTELKKYKTSWLINRSIAKRLANQNDAMQDIELALKIDPLNPNVIRTKAGVLFEAGSRQEAIQWLLDNTHVLEGDPSLTFMLAGMYKQVGKVEEAVDILKGLLLKENGETPGHDVKRLLIQLYLDNSSFNEAEKVFKQIPDTSELKVLNLLEDSRIKFAKGLESEAVKVLIKAKKAISADTPKRHKLELANLLYSHKKFRESAGLFEMIIGGVSDDDITRRFINSLYQDRQYTKALEQSELLRQKTGLSKYIVEIESSIFDDIGDPAKAETICKDYLEINPTDKEIRIRLAITKLRLGRDKQEIIENLKQVSDIQGLGFEHASQLARLYKDIGNSMKSLELAYEIRRSYHSIPDSHLYYIGIFLDLEKSNQDLLGKNTSGIDTVLKYRSSQGKEGFFILENREDADIRLSEINTQNELYQKLFGKKAGDEIEVNKISKEKISVIEIQSKYVYAFQQVTLNYNTLFPSGQGIVGFTFDFSTPETTSASIQLMLDQVSGVSKRIYAVEDFYNKGQLTIGAFAKIIGKNPIEIFGGLMATSTAKLRVAIGSTEEFREASDFFKALTSPKIIVDITSLMSIDGLGIADKVVKKYGKLAVTHTTIDLISEMISQKSGVAIKGYTHMYQEGDEFFREEFSEERVAESIAHFVRLKNWVTENCFVIPVPTDSLDKVTKQHEGESILGKSFQDTLLVASNGDYVLYTDDERLRSYAKVELGIVGIWTQLVLFELLNTKTITDDEYNLSVVKMINSNYHYTMINNRVLYRACKESDWNIENKNLVKAIDLLGEDYTNYLSGGAVASEFLYLLWTDEGVVSQKKKDISSYLIKVLTKRDGSKIEVLANLKKLIEKIFVSMPLLKEEVLVIINSTLKH